MCLKNVSPFTRMILGAVLGVTLGLIFGLLFGILISFLANSVGSFITPISYHRETIPYEISSFFGMSVGSIIGAILGAINANKK